jgi:hypothetical protein
MSLLVRIGRGVGVGDIGHIGQEIFTNDISDILVQHGHYPLRDVSI